MAREISIHEVAREILLAELRHVVEYFRDQGHQPCELRFGWHWGMDYPPDLPWEAMNVPLVRVEAEVAKPEEAGLGEFGSDDVFLRVPSIDGEFCFCHHQGVHLTYNELGPLLNHFLERWTSAGWEPVERDCESSH